VEIDDELSIIFDAIDEEDAIEVAINWLNSQPELEATEFTVEEA